MSYMADKHISFIICKSNEIAYQRLMTSLSKLIIPEGIQADIITVTEEENRAKAYNIGMSETTAKYKIYVDENVEINDQYIIKKMLNLFQHDEKVGIVGLSGAKVLPTSGISFLAKKRIGKLIIDGELVCWGEVKSQYETVCSVDGYFIATQYDIKWRDDLFFEKTYFDTAQCLEFKKSGYESVVISQELSGCSYYPINMEYSRNSQEKFLQEYSFMLYPKVLVMIPTFNRPHYFKLALESAINQRYKNLEIVVSDDSTDNLTARLIKKYLYDTRIKYYKHENFSAKDNWAWMRQYVKDTDCQYINWLMDDDIFHEDKIFKMMDYYLEYDNVALVTSHRQPIDKDGNFLQDIGATKRICNQDTIFSGDVIGKNILCNMLNFVGEPTTVLFKKEYLKDGDFGWTDLEEDYTAEDFPTYLHILEKGDLAYITDTLSYFRLHDGQCQRNLGINVRSTLCWIIDMQYAFQQKLYIKTIEDYRQAVFRVVDVAVNLLRKTADAGIANDDTALLWKKVIELLSELQKNEGNGIAYEKTKDLSVLWGRFK